METGRRDPRARLVRTPSTATRLADVVRCFGNPTAKSLVRRVDRWIAARLTRCEQAARKESISVRTAALHPRYFLSLPFHHHERTSTNRSMVETPGTSRIFPRGVA